MMVIGSHSYNRPGFMIAEHDLSGKIDNVDLMVSEDRNGWKSWHVVLRGIEVSAYSVIQDLFNNSSDADHLIVEQNDRTNRRDPSFSGRVLVSKINLGPNSTFIELTGTGPVNLLTWPNN